jgi:hypothetical protein
MDAPQGVVEVQLLGYQTFDLGDVSLGLPDVGRGVGPGGAVSRSTFYTTTSYGSARKGLSSLRS